MNANIGSFPEKRDSDGFLGNCPGEKTKPNCRIGARYSIRHERDNGEDRYIQFVALDRDSDIRIKKALIQ